MNWYIWIRKRKKIKAFITLWLTTIICQNLPILYPVFLTCQRYWSFLTKNRCKSHSYESVKKNVFFNIYMKTDPPRPHVQSNLPKEYNWCFSQGWEFTHSLKFLRTNEQMWAIRWGRTGQMSDSERITEVFHDKWANVSDSLRLLRTNERMSKWHSFFEQITHFLFCSQKMSNLLNKIRKNVFLGKFVTVFL